MKVISVKNNFNISIKGPLVLKPNLFKDKRGFFYESWNKKSFNEILGFDLDFVQDNISKSSKSVLRGLHYQLNPAAQAKLITVISGAIFDVIVDLRRNSPTFKSWAGVRLNEENRNSLWIPEGFAHGFLSMKDNTIIQYKVTKFWNNSLDRSLNWNDRNIKVEWPFREIDVKAPNLSQKDHDAPSFIHLEINNQLFL